MSMLKLFSEAASSTKAGREKVRTTTAHHDLRAEGWKKTHTTETGHNVYKHQDFVGHEIHVDPKSGGFEHKVKYDPSLHQTGAVAKGRSELAKHLNTHHRQVSYSHDKEHHSRGMDRGREGYDSAPGPRGQGG